MVVQNDAIKKGLIFSLWQFSVVYSFPPLLSRFWICHANKVLLEPVIQIPQYLAVSTIESLMLFSIMIVLPGIIATLLFLYHIILLHVPPLHQNSVKLFVLYWTKLGAILIIFFTFKSSFVVLIQKLCRVLGIKVPSLLCTVQYISMIVYSELIKEC